MKKIYLKPVTAEVRVEMEQIAVVSDFKGNVPFKNGGIDTSDEINRVKADWCDIWGREE